MELFDNLGYFSSLWQMLSKLCKKCGMEKSITEFYKQPRNADGYRNRCKACARLEAVIWRVRNLEKCQAHDRARAKNLNRIEQNRRNSKRRTKLYPTRRNANLRLKRAIKCGLITKSPCEVCGNPISNAHHNDYGKPLEVRWLCAKHHHAVHRKYDYDKLPPKL